MAGKPKGGVRRVHITENEVDDVVRELMGEVYRDAGKRFAADLEDRVRRELAGLPSGGNIPREAREAFNARLAQSVRQFQGRLADVRGQAVEVVANGTETLMRDRIVRFYETLPIPPYARAASTDLVALHASYGSAGTLQERIIGDMLAELGENGSEAAVRELLARNQRMAGWLGEEYAAFRGRIIQGVANGERALSRTVQKVVIENISAGRNFRESMKIIEREVFGTATVAPSKASQYSIRRLLKTETYRAVSESRVNQGRENPAIRDPIHQMGNNPCDTCVAESGGHTANEQFEGTWDNSPPWHPNCDCDACVGYSWLTLDQMDAAGLIAA